MKRTAALKVLNPMLGALAMSQVLTGILHDFLPRQIFGTVHKAGGLAFAAAAVLHLSLNWNWIKANYFRRHSVGGGVAGN